ncbi:MAG: histidine phosphatase family protein [Planctomycetia bacterium]|nr:histidine phosphatase family protein [Planctomycetia bacterium]
MILYCIRHGESTYNSQGRVQGQADPPLSDLGRAQARALAAALAEQAVEAVFASPLKRAFETAEIVAGALGVLLSADDRLKEIDVGVFQGKTWEEIEADTPEAAAGWQSHDPDFVIPGGESRRQLMERAAAAFRAIRETGYARVAVIAHGGTISAALKVLLEIPARRNPFSLVNAAISKLEWPEGREDRVKLLSLNDVEHLRSVELEHQSGDL